VVDFGVRSGAHAGVMPASAKKATVTIPHWSAPVAATWTVPWLPFLAALLAMAGSVIVFAGVTGPPPTPIVPPATAPDLPGALAMSLTKPTRNSAGKPIAVEQAATRDHLTGRQDVARAPSLERKLQADMTSICRPPDIDGRRPTSWRSFACPVVPKPSQIGQTGENWTHDDAFFAFRQIP
jgi:hypothetical protein